MSPRLSLPGADELFRATAPAAAAADEAGPAAEAEQRSGGADREQDAAGAGGRASRRAARRRSGATSGRERHDEKITVYVSAGELVDLEQARLSLRAHHGIAVDRGRIVREALAVVLADLDAKEANSILVRRLGAP